MAGPSASAADVAANVKPAAISSQPATAPERLDTGDDVLLNGSVFDGTTHTVGYAVYTYSRQFTAHAVEGVVGSSCRSDFCRHTGDDALWAFGSFDGIAQVVDTVVGSCF